MDDKKVIVIAIGGNSLIEENNNVSVATQYEAARKTASHIVKLIADGNKVIIVHGNGPQVGFALLRSEMASELLHTEPLDSCVADTQGSIGYLLQKALYNEAIKIGLSLPVATVITQVEVDKDDAAFANPTKPIGLFMDEKEAKNRLEKDGWSILEDSGRGYRRVVASPKPKAIVELETIKTLIDNNITVIAVGGGGIPVVKTADNSLKGCEAVIDKDLASALLAKEINADLFVVSTAVEKVSLNYNKPNQIDLKSLTLDECRSYIKQGHFGVGSMLPKIEAIIDFVESTNKMGLITNYENIWEALYGDKGTKITP